VFPPRVRKRRRKGKGGGGKSSTSSNFFMGRITELRLSLPMYTAGGGREEEGKGREGGINRLGSERGVSEE